MAYFVFKRLATKTRQPLAHVPFHVIWMNSDCPAIAQTGFCRQPRVFGPGPILKRSCPVGARCEEYGWHFLQHITNLLVALLCSFFHPFAVGNIVACFQKGDCRTRVVALKRPTTRHYRLASVFLGADKFTLP